jgi:hypothetical protein
MIEILVWSKEDFQTSSWILQAMLLRFVGHHKACEQKHNATIIKVRNITKG